MKIAPPTPEEYAGYYQSYVEEVHGNVIKVLEDGKKKMIRLLSKLSRKQLHHRYAEGKWSIQEIAVHVMDAERIFAYRALCFARNDQTELPGFEENDYAPASKADDRKIKSIINEYKAVREATLELFNNLDEEMLMRKGIANGKTMSVRAFAYCIAGHEIHHMNVIREKYLGEKKEEK